MNQPEELPAVTVQVENAGATQIVQLDPALVRRARDLVDDVWRYFEYAPEAQLIEIRHLVQSRMRPEGVANAVDLMAQAYEGLYPRRAPLTVTRRADGLFQVEDGNSTVTVAAAAGWVAVACIVTEPSQGH